MGRVAGVPVVKSASEGPESDGPDRVKGVEMSSTMDPSPSSLYYRGYVRRLLGGSIGDARREKRKGGKLPER